ncbi:uncharacterized protein LAESUDRAFT_4720 [Laetiporus sulphureus 93-53]|uniref:Uncharacterized protein n=1 Tax=Laetiporus sulphureus 93-53 TaxID=1314785 RepID=A0A165I3G2_9APHY|nr:uncharacterized protein LAESUDRAFT_4720 [Laetiporus sulphureus 93-53]KZT12545.1 hypothetical protein LAESUDRAFT_4720 [Laetiporus sulphureus 93-53]
MSDASCTPRRTQDRSVPAACTLSRATLRLLDACHVTKRPFTDEQLGPGQDLNFNESTGLDPDLRARLRSMASRVRKSATEGYATSAPVSPTVSPAKPRLPFTQSLPFRSAHDTLRDVYSLDYATNPNSSFAPSPSSTRKRKLVVLEEIEEGRSFSNTVDRSPGEDNTSESLVQSPNASTAQSRPTRPLRRTFRRDSTRSLPAGAFRFQGIEAGAEVFDPLLMQEEEDWSGASFPQ